MNSGSETIAEAKPDGSAGADSGRGVRWWLWPNVLSLDAPVVAIAWLWLLAATYRIKLVEPAYTLFVLGSSVWAIYVMDRLLDGIKVADENALSPRHRFYRKNRGIYWALVIGAILASFWIVMFHLPGPILKLGLMLGLVAGFYIIQCAVGRQLGKGMYTWFPKEVFCGVIFAIGVSIPVLHWMREAPPLVDIAIMAGLFALNCVAIALYEKKYDADNDPLAVTRVWPIIQVVYPFLLLALLVVSLWATWSRLEEGTHFLPLAVGVGVALLGLLQAVSKVFSEDALRVLADVALLIPPVLVTVLFVR